MNFETLKGKTFTEINGLEKDSEKVVFLTSDGAEYHMHHDQDCCEHVSVEDVAGDVADLIGSPILLAEEVVADAPDEDVMAARRADYEKNHRKDWTSFENWHRSYYESETWTFYKLATIKGSVTIRWLGTSNGYYSESVSFECVREPHGGEA